MKSLVLSLSLAVLAGCGVAYAAEHDAQQDHGWGGAQAGPMTRAQAQEMAGRMFERMDVNHDGKLDVADREARRAAMRQAMFEQMDVNHDGQISRDEFMNFRPAGREGGMGGHDMRGHGMGGMGGMGEMRGMGGMMMRMADTNHDGVVTREEFTAAVNKHFDQMDANHDGTVTPEERRAAHEAMRRQMGGRMEGHEMGGHEMGDHEMGGHEMGGHEMDGAMPPPPSGH